MKKSALLLIMSLVMLMLPFKVSAKDETGKMSKVKFTVASKEIKDNNDTIILIYRGEDTDLFVALSPNNKYKDVQKVPEGKYALIDAYSGLEKDYSYDLTPYFVASGNTKVEVGTLSLTGDEISKMTEGNIEKATEKPTYIIITSLLLAVIVISIFVFMITKKNIEKPLTKKEE